MEFLRIVPFSSDVAEQLLNYAYAAYCPQNQLQTWNCQWCKDGFYPVAFPYDRRTNTFGYVGVNMTDRTSMYLRKNLTMYKFLIYCTKTKLWLLLGAHKVIVCVTG